MSNIGFTCDVCGRTVQGCTFVNGMKFCAKCYQETFGNKNERNLDVEMATEMVKLAEENKQLKQQLAEKDKEIEELRDEIARQKYAENTTDYWVRKNIKEQEIRKQVCDEIRDISLDFYYFQSDATKFDGNLYLLSKFDLENILDQIEIGEKI